MDVVRTLIESQALSSIVIPIVLPSYIKGSEDDPFAITDMLRITGSFLRILSGSAFDAYKRLRTLSVVANSSSAMSVVADSSMAMNVVANSETAMNVVANSETAMNVVANSETALGIMRASSIAIAAVHDSTAGRNVLSQSEHLFKWFWTYEVAEYGLLQTTQTSTTDSATTFGSLGSDTNKWLGGTLAPNGNIYGIPFNSTVVLKINPSNDSITTFGSLGSDTSKWTGGVLAPNGNIYGMPYNSTSILKISFSSPSYKTELGSPYYNKY